MHTRDDPKYHLMVTRVPGIVELITYYRGGGWREYIILYQVVYVIMAVKDQWKYLESILMIQDNVYSNK